MRGGSLLEWSAIIVLAKKNPSIGQRSSLIQITGLMNKSNGRHYARFLHGSSDRFRGCGFILIGRLWCGDDVHRSLPTTSRSAMGEAMVI